MLYALAPRRATGGAVERWQMHGRFWLVQRLYNSGLLEFIVPYFGIVAQSYSDSL
jgi:hypothetical protein